MYKQSIVVSLLSGYFIVHSTAFMNLGIELKLLRVLSLIPLSINWYFNMVCSTLCSTRADRVMNFWLSVQICCFALIGCTAWLSVMIGCVLSFVCVDQAVMLNCLWIHIYYLGSGRMLAWWQKHSCVVLRVIASSCSLHTVNYEE